MKPILEVANHGHAKIKLVIEPQLESYKFDVGVSVSIYYPHSPDDRVPDKTLSVAYNEKEILVFPPGGISPEVYLGKRKQVPELE